VILMRLREGEQVSALAPVVESTEVNGDGAAVPDAAAPAEEVSAD
jgi:hypothetical protein